MSNRIGIMTEQVLGDILKNEIRFLRNYDSTIKTLQFYQQSSTIYIES